MRNYLVLTGFLIGTMFGVIIVGQQLIMAYENSAHAKIEEKILESKVSEINALKEIK